MKKNRENKREKRGCSADEERKRFIEQKKDKEEENVLQRKG